VHKEGHFISLREGTLDLILVHESESESVRVKVRVRPEWWSGSGLDGGLALFMRMRVKDPLFFCTKAVVP
jgi:hypothetical protein